ncbi:MAG TPA: ABC transporter permease [Thermoanaerobaculia bacterium]|nr:ABC transporter permease [Thermoanaerobaculia bacterium]
MRRRGTWANVALESAALAVGSIRSQPLRSGLAIVGVVIGIVTVVVVTSVLAGVRNQIALLFREFGTDNVFAYHRSGDPYARPSQDEAQRKGLDPAFAPELARLGEHIRDVGVQIIVPQVVNGRALVARGGGNESDAVLVEGVSSNYFDVVSADLAAGRPFTDLENRAGARVAVLGSNIARALYGTGNAVGRTLVLGGVGYTVVGEAAPRKGGFFGENRQDNVVAIPAGTARRLYPEADATVFYIRAEPGQRDLARVEAEAILRRLRRLGPDQPNDFNLSTADQIIAQFDRLSAVVGLVTVALAAVSLLIGGIGIANVMVIAVTERTREIGIRRAVGAQRGEVLRQFLLEAAILSGAGGLFGVVIASALGLLLSIAAPGFPAIPPLSVVATGLGVSFLAGIIAGYGPARRAAALEPVEALRYE